jgi:hypothetical protein
MPSTRIWLLFLLLLAINYVIGRQFLPGPKDPVPVSYIVFRAELADDNVEAVHTQGPDDRGAVQEPDRVDGAAARAG